MAVSFIGGGNPEYPEKTTDKLYHILLYRNKWKEKQTASNKKKCTYGRCCHKTKNIWILWISLIIVYPTCWLTKLKKISNAPAPKVRKPSCELMDGQCLVIQFLKSQPNRKFQKFRKHSSCRNLFLCQIWLRSLGQCSG